MSEGETIRLAAKAAEHGRLNAKRAAKGWLFRILPIGSIMILVLLYILQKASGLPVYDVLGFSACDTDPQNNLARQVKDECERRRSAYSQGQLNVARIAIIVVILFVCLFMYEVFGSGVGGGLIGGLAGKSPGLETRAAIRSESVAAQTQSDITFNAAKQMSLQNPIPGGTTSTGSNQNSLQYQQAPQQQEIRYSPGAMNQYQQQQPSLYNDMNQVTQQNVDRFVQSSAPSFVPPGGAVFEQGSPFEQHGVI